MRTQEKNSGKIAWIVNSYPVYLSIAVIWGLAYFGFIPVQVRIIRFDTVISSIVTAAITTIGFFFTIITILITLFDRKVMKFILKHKGNELLTQYFAVPILAGILLIGYSFYLGGTVGIDPVLSRLKFSFLLGIGFIFCTGILRIGAMLLLILGQIAREYESTYIDTESVSEANEDDVFCEPVSDRE